MSVIEFRGKKRPEGLTEAEQLVAKEERRIRQLVAKLRRMFPWVEPDDVFQTVNLGYVEAARDYDPTKSDFSPYAYTQVLHRSIDVFDKEARHSPSRLARMWFLTLDLEALKDPWLSDEEILDIVRAACEEGAFRMFMGASFETWRWEGEEGLLDHLAVLQAFKALKESFTSLTEDEWRVYELYYIDCLTWAKVGETLGISERQAQRRADYIHTKLKRELSLRGIAQAPPAAP